MKKYLAVVASVLSLALCPQAANAALKTVTLAVPGMDCAVCPITVKKALAKVAGVSQVTVSFDKRQAVVSFDDTKTTTQALTDSTKNAGYPSTVVGSAN
jgi:periplasmic mercuric ion binding protein